LTVASRPWYPGAVRIPKLGRMRDVWPGLTLSGVVVLAAAVLADAFGDPPRGGPRLFVGLGLGAACLALGYLLRLWEKRQP
jgi:hypothetical protein